MDRHVTILGAFHIAFGALGLAAALAILVVFGGVAGLIGLGAASDPDALIAVPIIGIVGTILMLAVTILSLPGIVAGFGLMYYRPWARLLTVVLSLLHLFNFPFGSALGAYGLWVLLSDETRMLFERSAAPGAARTGANPDPVA